MKYRFYYTGIRVRNLNRSLAFYTKAIGMKVVNQGTMRHGGKYVQLVGAGSHELHVLATVAHRPLVHDLHSDGLRVEGEGPVEVPNANARVVESILHRECNPGRRYVVATVIRRRWPLSSHDDRPDHHGMKRTVVRIRPRLGERVLHVAPVS